MARDVPMNRSTSPSCPRSRGLWPAPHVHPLISFADGAAPRFGRRLRPLGGGFGVFAAGCLLLVGLLGLSANSHASHYRLGAVGLLNAKEVRQLSAAGIHTTKELLEGAATSRQRVRLARKTKMKRFRITVLATQCDLLRIEGVGPTMVRLFQASGYQHTAALKRATPRAVWKNLVAANQAHRLLPQPPAKALVAKWVRAASASPAVLKGVK